MNDEQGVKWTFQAWMQALDAECRSAVGVSVCDLADAPFRDWYDDGLSSAQAWQAYLEEGYDDALSMLGAFP